MKRLFTTISCLILLMASMAFANKAEAQFSDLTINQFVSTIVTPGGVTLPAGETSAPIGSTVTFTINVTNNLPIATGALNDVRVRELFSGPMSGIVVAGLPVGASCTTDLLPAVPEVTEITCDFDPLTANQTVSFTMTGTLDAAGQVDKIGAVEEALCIPFGQQIICVAIPDLNPFDNVATASVIGGSVNLPNANLIVNKTADILNPIAGVDTVTYTINVLNLGPDAAPSVLLTDFIFGDITMAPPVSAGWTCLPFGPNPPVPPATFDHNIFCTLDAPLASAAFAPPLVLTGTPNSAGPITNTVGVTPINAQDLDQSDNNVAITVIAVDAPPPLADLSITKSIDNSNAQPSDVVTYTVSVTNSSGAAVTQIIATDHVTGPQTVIPASLPAFCALSPNPGAANAEIIVCSGALNAGQTFDFSYQATVDDFGQGDNIVCISASTVNDTNTSNNCAISSFISVEQSLPPADLWLRKWSDNLNPEVGNAPNDIVTYSIRVRNTSAINSGPLDLRDIIVGNIQITSVAGGGFVCAQSGPNPPVAGGQPRRINCTHPGIPAASARTLTVIGTALGTGPITDTATVAPSPIGATTSDPDLSNNTQSVTVVAVDPVAPTGDLSINKTVTTPLSTTVGTPVTYQIEVENIAGPDQTNVLVVDSILGEPTPADVAGIVINFAGCPGGGGSSNIGTTLYLTINSLLAGGTCTIEYSITPTLEGVLSNIATVFGEFVDTQLNNNTASANVAVNREQADLEVVKFAEVETAPGSGVFAPGSVAEIGDRIRFTVEVTNTDPVVVATGVNISDNVSGPMDFESATLTTGGTCTPAAPPPAAAPLIIECNPGGTNSIAAISTAIIQVVGIVNGPGQIDNVAVASSTGTADPNTSNNVAVASVITDVPSVDLSITKSVAPNPAAINDTVTFTIVVSNPGPNPVTNATVTDHVSGPATVNIGSFSVVPAGGICSAVAAPGNPPVTIITCDWDTMNPLPVGDTTITYEANVDGLGQIDNTASVDSIDIVDPNMSNNTGVASLNGTPLSADLSVIKSVDNPNASISDIVTFTITVDNLGPDDATAVRLTDIISGPLVNVTAPGCNITLTPPVTSITCDLGVIGPADPPVIVTVMGEVDDLGQIDNIASVADLGVLLPTLDPDLSNNSAVASVIGNEQEADLSVIKVATPPTAAINDIVTFTSTVTNNGPATVAIGDAQFTETISGPFTVTMVNEPAGTSCAAPVITGAVTVITCTNTGPFISGASAPIDVVGMVTGLGAISNTVAVSGANTADPNTTNNVATADVNGTPLQADLSVLKTVDISNGTSIGDDVTFTIEVRNNGSDAATNVAVTDQVIAPAGAFTITSIVTSVGTCTPTSPPDVPAPVAISCTLGALAPMMPADPPETITVVGLITGLGQIENTAVVTDTDDGQGTPATTDPNVSDNVSVASTVGIPTNVNLSITKDVRINGNIPVNFEATPLDTVEFIITITNDDTNDAQGVTITDVLTGPFQIDTITMSDSGACAPNSGASPPIFITTCTPDNGTAGVIGAGATITITMTGQVTATGQVDNTATVASTITNDPNLSNNTAVTSVIAVPTPVDLTVTKTVDDPQATVGQVVMFTVTVSNNDPVDQPALGVLITDFMTGPINVTSVTPDSGACQATPMVPAVAQPFMSIVCIPLNGQIAPGETVTILVEGEITDEGQVDNLVSVDNVPSAAPDGVITEDPNTSNNTAIASVIGDLRADLRITKTVQTPVPVAVGDTVTYVIEVFNDGPNPANNVVVTDMALGPVANVNLPANCTAIDDNNFNCTLLAAPLASGASETITYDLEFVQPGFWFNIVTTSATEFDPILANNTISANVPVEVTELADLAITKDADVTEVKSGDDVNYTIVVTNNGPQDATNVVVSDFTAGPFTAITNIAIDSGSCDPADQGLIVCSIPLIASGNSVTLTYTLTAGMPGVLSDLATVGGQVLDPDASNNSAAFQVKVLARQADLSIQKEVGPNPVGTGLEATYVLRVRNDGPDTATNVRVIDQVSGNVSGVTADADNGGACTVTETAETTVKVDCDIGDMDADTEVLITITLTADGPVSNVISNIAAVSSETEDPVLANNTTTADTITITPPPQPINNPTLQGGGENPSGCALGTTQAGSMALVFCLAGAAVILGYIRRRKAE